MPKRKDIKTVLVIGSGPIVIGQAAEFDYAGTQACLALKEEGYKVILVNSNPATIMTDTAIADKVYMEPLTLEYVAKIIRYERPDAILPGIGGQTGLNIAMQLYKKGVLQECQVELLGTSSESIEKAEDREKFKELCEQLGEPILESIIAHTIEEGVEAANKIGYPVVLRPAFTLGGTGGGFADDDNELREIIKHALKLSPVGQVLVEKSIKGYKEIEYEVIRDSNDTAITVCNMENLDPVGVHTGDSIVVAPSQTLTNKEYQMLRDSALKIIRALKIEGGCNVQFALDPHSFQYYLIEVNPRVSRSSALASKASGYPIARVSAKIAVGMRLDEIKLANTPASFEPTLDYIVTKIARFPFDKFVLASNKLSTQMKATGEVMSVGRTFEESLLKAVRSLEIGVCHIYMKKFDSIETEELMEYIKDGRDDRIYAVAELIRRNVDLGLIYNTTKIDMFFLEKIKHIIKMENKLKDNAENIEILKKAKKMGFSDKYIGEIWNKTEEEIYERILDNNKLSLLFPFKNFFYEIVNTIKESVNRESYQDIIKSYVETLVEEKEEALKQYNYFNEFYIYYQSQLYGSEVYKFDYSDLLYYANKYIENIGVNNELNFEYVIIDEYQDISQYKYELTKKTVDRNHAKIYAVGDDWQSIYAFSGSRIEYTYNFLSYFPTAKILKISKAYRNSRQLIKYSSDFIMKNTDQISKQLLSTKENPSPIKFVFFEEGKEYQKLKELILAIHKNNKNSHILILGRTNKIIDTMYEEPELIDDMETKVKYQGYDDIDIDGMTIHKSKGLTSDEVIIIGVDSRFPKPYYGDFWLKEIYKNNWYEEKIPFAEERRLFYVALTRTKNNVYLLVNKDADNRSPFINEIYNIMINNKESI